MPGIQFHLENDLTFYKSVEGEECTSNKRKIVEYTQEDDYQKLKLEIEIKFDAKRIKAAGFFDHPYWCQRGKFSEKQSAHSKLYKKQSINDFLKVGNGDEKDWKHAKQAQKIHEEKSVIELQLKLYKKQSERMIACVYPRRSKKKSFAKLTTRRRILVSTIFITPSRQGVFPKVHQTSASLLVPLS